MRPTPPAFLTGVLTAILLAVGAPMPAPLAGQVAQGPPAADAADVESVDAIIAAVYEAISGPAGEARDWDRFRSLFTPDATLIPIGRASADGPRRTFRWSPDQYIERAGRSLEESGFFEREVHRVTEEFGPLVHVWSTYESRRSADDAEPFSRGINSFQLLDDGTRFWVVNILWSSESAANPIPERYLDGGM